MNYDVTKKGLKLVNTPSNLLAHLQRISSAHRMRQLCGQRRGDGMEIKRRAAVVDWHLPALSWLLRVAEALRGTCQSHRCHDASAAFTYQICRNTQ